MKRVSRREDGPGPCQGLRHAGRGGRSGRARGSAALLWGQGQAQCGGRVSVVGGRGGGRTQVRGLAARSRTEGTSRGGSLRLGVSAADPQWPPSPSLPYTTASSLPIVTATTRALAARVRCTPATSVTRGLAGRGQRKGPRGARTDPVSGASGHGGEGWPAPPGRPGRWGGEGDAGSVATPSVKRVLLQARDTPALPLLSVGEPAGCRACHPGSRLTARRADRLWRARRPRARSSEARPRPGLLAGRGREPRARLISGRPVRRHRTSPVIAAASLRQPHSEPQGCWAPCGAGRAASARWTRVLGAPRGPVRQ